MPARDDGDPLAPGVYVYRVSGEDRLKAGRIVIAGR
jgi:hypothetical protein